MGGQSQAGSAVIPARRPELTGKSAKASAQLHCSERGPCFAEPPISLTGTDFAEKFESLIDSYNAGSRTVEELFDELLKLSGSLNEEQRRHVRENMTEEELVIFDILTRPAPELSTEERAEVKKVARDLLARLKDGLTLLRRKARIALRDCERVSPAL